MKHPEPISRRDFIQTTGKTAAALAASTMAAPYVLRGAEPTANPVGIGHIGLGTRGGNVIRAAASKKSCKIVAVCDVYEPHLQKGVELSNNPDVKAYVDYKEMLADPKVEAVLERWSVEEKLKAIRHVVQECEDAGRELSVCGEAAGSLSTACLLVGLGVRQLSMSPVRAARVRSGIRSVQSHDLVELAEQAVQSDGVASVRRLLHDLQVGIEAPRSSCLEQSTERRST